MGRPKGSRNKRPYPCSNHVTARIYGETGRQFRKHKMHFRWLHARVRKGYAPSVEWPADEVGLKAFVAEIGPIPAHLMKPSVGRKDHDKGYESGNIMWEENNFNSSKSRGNFRERQPDQSHRRRSKPVTEDEINEAEII